MKNTLSLSQLLANETPGGRGLLAAEIAQKTGRTEGPIDGRCEVCGEAADSFTLQDWMRWHCVACVLVAISEPLNVA